VAIDVQPNESVSAGLTTVLLDAARHAGEQLSMFMERDVRLRGTSARRVRLEHLPEVLDGDGQLVTAIYLAFEGDIAGHVVLAFAPEVAAQMAAALLMEEPSTEFGAMELSALGEIGNITTASFLNTIAGACSLTVYPTPPTVVQDMVGALLDGVILEMSMESTDALLLHTIFEIDGDRLQGALILLPDAASCAQLEGLLATCQ
jgi:chemotaxis protein CheC